MGLLTGKPTLCRAMPVSELELDGDGRTLEVLMVPWDTTARIVEPDPSDFEKILDYQEGFRRGAFDRQIDAGVSNPRSLGRITFKDQHEGGYGKLGRVRHLENTNAGLYGRIRVDTDNVQKVRDARDDGITDLSVEFHPLKSEGNERVRGSEVWRTDVYLTAVALEPMGAYQGAEVLAMRAAADHELEHAEQAAKLAEIDSWLEAEKGRWD